MKDADHAVMCFFRNSSDRSLHLAECRLGSLRTRPRPNSIRLDGRHQQLRHLARQWYRLRLLAQHQHV